MPERWRYQGTNWEGRAWKASAAVRRLGNAISAAWPQGFSTDGTVASQPHDAENPLSDHRPFPYEGAGIVRAIDVGVPSRAVGDMLVNCILGDSRISYVLWQVPNHTRHFHVSMKANADRNEREWYVFTQHEVEELKSIIAGLDAVDSNGSFVVQCVEDIRAKNAAGGSYAPLNHGPHTGGGIQPNTPVKIVPV